MKLNWGNSLAIAIALFMGFILYFVFTASQIDVDLDSEDYYQREITYQDRIDAIRNAADVKEGIAIHDESVNVVVEYPKALANKTIKGTLYFFRPDNAALDKTFPMEVKQKKQLIPKDVLVKGKYLVKLEWSHQHTNYLVEKMVVIH